MKKKILAIAATAVIFLGGCAANQTEPVETPASLEAGAPNAEQSGATSYERYYTQDVRFEPCSADQVTSDWASPPKDLDRYYCTKIFAPLNWDDPQSAPIELAVARYSPAGGDENRRLLFFNLGGPGGDAVQSFSVFNSMILPEDILEAYDTVAVDPRGVGQSTAVTCWDTKERDKFFARTEPGWQDMTLEETLAKASEELGEIGTQCASGSDDLLGYVDTDSAARDFDLVRVLLGQEKMDYLGFSYGTLLGATYADLFPDNVGRFVLDAALDPSFDVNQVTALQAQGMEESLYNWIETCQSQPGCPLTGDLESGKQQMVDFFAAVDKEPIATADPARELTGSLARTGVIGSLYSTDSYELLTMGMDSALAGDGTILLTLADFYNGRGIDGTYTNTQDAFLAINALDYQPVGTPEQWLAQAQELAATYPVFGPDFGFASAGLDAWPVTARVKRSPISGVGTPEILIIGGTHDPATPYVMAEAMAASFENGILVTRDGWGHGSYERGASGCILDAVTPFLLEGTAPADGTVCVD